MSARATLRCGDRTLALGQRTWVMGVLNLTPDSFSDGGKYTQLDAALKQAERMLEEGADILDIGGESTRPFAAPVRQSEELERVLPLVRVLAQRGITNLSIDTRNARTFAACLDMGASWLNDVSALSHDSQMADVAKHADAVVLMHAKGTPDVMQSGEIVYQDPVAEVRNYLAERVSFALQAGLSNECLLVDPGIGFGKRLPHNLGLIRGLGGLNGLSAGVLCGTSRKAFIGELTQIRDAAERDAPSLAAMCASVAAGADIVRVHNVKASVEALKVADALYRGLA